MNTSGNLVNFGSITTTPLYNGFFNQGVALPASGAYINANTANVPGWTFTPGTNINLCNGSVPGVFTGVLPSTVTYYIDISQNVAQSTSLSQYVGIYQGTSGFVSFYGWPKDVSYNGTESISVSLGGITLLNQYTFTPVLLTGTTYTSFNLPFSMVAAGTYLLTITVTNPSTYLSGINFGGVQIRSLSTPAIGYKNIDPSGLALYYPFDSNTVSGTVVYDCSAGFTGLIGSADASLCGGAQLDTLKYITGNADVSLNGSTCYVQMGNWTCPGANIGNGFTICGWFNPSTIEPSNATLCLFQNTGTNSLISVFLNQQNRWLDFSYNLTSGTGAVGTQTEYIANTVSLTTNGWNYFAMTGSCSTVGVMNLTYFLNDVSLASLTGGWPTSGTALTFTSNTMGGTPLNVPMNSAGKLGFFQGYMDDFRVYNRALSQNDIFALWSYGFSKNSYANLIDPSGMGMYYPMEQGSTLTKSAPSPFTGFTPSAISASGFTLTWTGGAGVVNSYVYGVTPSGGSRSVLTPSGTPPTVVFSGLTAPSSAPYNWAVDISLTNTAGTTIGNTTVYAPPTALVLSGAYSAGNVTLTWTGGLGNAVTVSYTITSGSATTTSGTGITSPYSAPVTAGGGPWTFSVTATNTIGSVNTTTTVSQNPFTISSITTTNGSYTTDQKSSLSSSLATGNGIVGGTSVTNGITYTCYAFGQTSTWGTYTLTYTCTASSYIYVLAVGGGGSGGSYAGGGGGGGGVVMLPVLVPACTNQTVTVSVGPGGAGAGTSNHGISGTNTTVVFNGTGGNATTPSTLKANGGGGGGGTSANIAGYNGGSGGGGSGFTTAGTGGGIGITSGYNYANNGANRTANGSGGGGGAGGIGLNNTVAGNNGGNGGAGMVCALTGIKDFSPSGTTYGTYYWGGGGGGSGDNANTAGNGGSGGGGGGSTQPGGVPASGNTSGISSSGSGVSGAGGGGAGGTNTGGGGGADWNSASGGTGGSGIVVVAFPGASIPIVTLTVTSVSSTGFTLNFASVTNASSYVLYVNNVLYGSAITAGTNNTITYTSTIGFFVIDFYAKDSGGKLIAEGHINATFFIYTNATVMPLPSTGTTGASALTLNAYSTVITGITGTLSFMNGSYTVSSSSTGGGTVPYTMFNGTYTGSEFWICNYGGNSYNQNAYSSYVYQGGINPYVYVTTTVSGVSVAGEWLQLQFPYSFVLTGHGWLGRNASTEWIGLIYTIAGSNDGTTWTQVIQKTYTLGTQPSNGTGSYIESVVGTVAYSYYRLICTSALNDSGANWYGKKWYLYGSH